jgi:hypothetical protein
MNNPAYHPQRRSFLARFYAGGAAIAGLILGSAASAQAKPSKPRPEPARYIPPRHPEDDWMDQVPGKHRMLFDTGTPEGAARAITFSANFLQVNEVDYGLKEESSAIIFVVRYRWSPSAITTRSGPNTEPRFRISSNWKIQRLMPHPTPIRTMRVRRWTTSVARPLSILWQSLACALRYATLLRATCRVRSRAPPALTPMPFMRN